MSNFKTIRIELPASDADHRAAVRAEIDAEQSGAGASAVAVHDANPSAHGLGTAATRDVGQASGNVLELSAAGVVTLGNATTGGKVRIYDEAKNDEVIDFGYLNGVAYIGGAQFPAYAFGTVALTSDLAGPSLGSNTTQVTGGQVSAFTNLQLGLNSTMVYPSVNPGVDVTMPPVSGTLDLATEYKTANFTAEKGKRYNVNDTDAGITVADPAPAPAEGDWFDVFVQGGSVTVGGIARTDGLTIKSHYVGGGWERNIYYPSSGPFGTAATRDAGYAPGNVVLVDQNGSFYATAANGSIGASGSEGSVFAEGANGYIYTSGANGRIGTTGENAYIYTIGANAFISTRAAFKLETPSYSASIKLAGALSADRDILIPDATGTVALTSYVDSAVSAAVVGLLDDRGNYNASGNVFPSSGGSGTAGAILKGDLWTISVAGTLGGVAVTVGDVLRALSDTPGQTAANWTITENNLGYVPQNTAGTLALAGFAAITGTLGVANGGTGQTTLTSGAILTGKGTGAVTFITPGTGVATALAVAAGASGGFVRTSDTATTTTAGVVTRATDAQARALTDTTTTVISPAQAFISALGMMRIDIALAHPNTSTAAGGSGAGTASIFDTSFNTTSGGTSFFRRSLINRITLSGDGGAVNFNKPIGFQIIVEPRQVTTNGYFRFTLTGPTIDTDAVATVARPTQKALGCYILNGLVYGVVHDGATRTETSLGLSVNVLNASPFGRGNNITCLRVASGSYEFFVNGVSGGTLTGGPTGLSSTQWSADYLCWHAAVSSGGDAGATNFILRQAYLLHAQ